MKKQKKNNKKQTLIIAKNNCNNNKDHQNQKNNVKAALIPSSFAYCGYSVFCKIMEQSEIDNKRQDTC